MKAAKGVNRERTDGNTDPLVWAITRIDDGNVVYIVPDGATVKLDVVDGSNVITINGVAVGDGSGRFAFAVDTLPAGESILPYDIDVDEGGQYITYIRGLIKTVAKRGT